MLCASSRHRGIVRCGMSVLVKNKVKTLAVVPSRLRTWGIENTLLVCLFHGFEKVIPERFNIDLEGENDVGFGLVWEHAKHVHCSGAATDTM